jgi:PHD/YefM family antitoxin component YafN of YafNO toxin-antitoxin module
MLKVHLSWVAQTISVLKAYIIVKQTQGQACYLMDKSDYIENWRRAETIASEKKLPPFVDC